MIKTKSNVVSGNMVCIELNRRILEKMGSPRELTLTEKDFKVIGEIEANKIFKQVNLLQVFESRLGGKKLNIGGLAEFMVSSMTGMHLLEGQTMRGPDAIKLQANNGLKPGRYQIKYRNWDTSDIAFRADVDSDGKLLENYEWDFLLIATHEANAIPNRLFVLPFTNAVELSEVITCNDPSRQQEPRTSGKGQNYYYSFRINWKWDRKGYGCTGSKRDLIAKTHKVAPVMEKHSVRILQKL